MAIANVRHAIRRVGSLARGVVAKRVDTRGLPEVWTRECQPDSIVRAPLTKLDKTG